jgi:hypothetical protein
MQAQIIITIVNGQVQIQTALDQATMVGVLCDVVKAAAVMAVSKAPQPASPVIETATPERLSSLLNGKG